MMDGRKALLDELILILLCNVDNKHFAAVP